MRGRLLRLSRTSRSRRFAHGLWRLALAAALLLLATAPAALAQKKTPLPADTLVRIGRLANGLTYYVRQNPEPRQRAELRLVVNAGSVLEDHDQRGLAHFVEHMAFNGTTNYARNQLVDYLERIGMRFGPGVNAYTGFDETVYMLQLPTDSAGIVQTGLQILEDWARGISFDSLEIERERGVVLEEWRLGQGVGSRTRERQFPVLFSGSRYAERLPIGDERTLRSFRPEALRRFYRDWYRPDLMAVVAVGDFDAAEMETSIRVQFADLPMPDNPRPRVVYAVPAHDSTLYSVVADPEATSASVSVHGKRPVQIGRTEASYRQALVETLYHAMLYDRLSELTLKPEAPLLSVGSSQGVLVRTKAADVLSATVRQHRVEEGLQVLIRESRRVAKHGFTASELERQKRDLLRRWEQMFDERQKMPSAQFAAEYVSHYLYGGPLLSVEMEYALHRRLLPTIPVKAVNAYARSLASPRDRVVMVTLPRADSVRVPSGTSLAAAVRAASQARVTAYRDSVSALPLVGRPPRPGRILAERAVPEAGLLEWTLSNGARVLLKPTDFKADEILFSARSPGGTSLAPDSLYIPALTAAGVAQVGGLGELSLTELVKELAGKAAGAGAFIDELHEGMSGAASSRDLETLFQIVYLRFTAPRADSTAFLAYQSRARAELRNRGASPEVAFQDTLQVTLTQNHPRAQPPSSALFDAMDMQQSLAFYRERFGDASDFTFYFVGSFRPDELRPLVERYLASLPAAGRRERWRDVGMQYPRGIVHKVVRRGTESRGQTQIVFTGPSAFTRENMLALSALSDVLEIRLRERLREDLGGTYGVHVSAGASRDPREIYRLAIGFGTAPERVEELTRGVFAEIDTLKTRGPHPAELAKVREQLLRDREVSLRENNFWMAQLMSFDRYGWDLREIHDFAGAVQALTPERLRDTARRVLDAQNYVQVTLLPELPAPRAERKGP